MELPLNVLVLGEIYLAGEYNNSLRSNVYRSVKIIYSVLLSPGMRPLIGAPDMFTGKMGIDLRGRDIGMAQQLLN